ncbi:early estrogen-induced gene 1 protein-like isoform X2 [Lineus longissimus]|uniref:early estrogen-induced gene 1 protein-like isoform X2 n=1 Tax=Lineus longissimus TaxID=88925 RepID=UPI002B4E7448
MALANMLKKKRYKFQVNFTVEELSSVPFVSGVMFAKVRLLDGGSFSNLSSREEIHDHVVNWNACFSFMCKMSASLITGVLEPCICRISVRRESKGGKAFQKLGFADINLAEYAGSGLKTKRFLLEGYDSKHRQDNSMLKVTIDMTLLSGDPCFKVPDSKQVHLPGDHIDMELQLENKGQGSGNGEDVSEASQASGDSSGFGSLPRKTKDSPDTEETTPPQNADQGHEQGHSRNSSYASTHSKGSGYASFSHSRNSSVGTDPGHTRSPSVGSGADYCGHSLERRRKIESESMKESRVESTRIDTNEVIDELFKDTDFKVNDGLENSGLQLFIAKDGTASLGGSHTMKSQMRQGKYKPVVIEDR